jgi:hypothetical protein
MGSFVPKSRIEFPKVYGLLFFDCFCVFTFIFLKLSYTSFIGGKI